ncbi:MAG: hypothetical protein LBU10_04375 [Endomicrobium sp.]|jgi:hypothetical protein|nr:hypothetical protein [Endomicrobium sp.]
MILRYLISNANNCYINITAHMITTTGDIDRVGRATKNITSSSGSVLNGAK